MKLGPRGEELIKSYEKLELKAYLPTLNDRPTIGWGSTKGVKMGDVITINVANELFKNDVAVAEKIVHRLNVPLTQAMFDSLTSLAFNTGTLGESIPEYLRSGDYYMACQSIFLWRKQAGRNLLGLARRRAREIQLFLEDGVNV